MKKLIRMTANNQVAVPTALARLLKLEKGCYLEIEHKNNKLIMTPKKVVDADTFDLYERAIRKARVELKKGQTSRWSDIKKNLSTR